MILKVTFDSNTWRKVASPNNFPKDPIIDDYKTIRQAINDGKIIPFISETVFTLEAIQKKHRKTFFKGYKPDIRTIITEENGAIKMSFKIGPNPKVHPGNNEFLKEHFADAVNLGFNVINLPRIGGIVNEEIDGYRYKMEGQILSDYLDKVFEVGKKITELEAGDYEIQKLGLNYDSHSWFLGIGKAPDSEDGIIAKAVAEWADGDSVASHVAIGGDYFCTNDKAVSGGAKSVFTERNLDTLNNEYNFKTISPSKLAEIIEAT